MYSTRSSHHKLARTGINERKEKIAQPPARPCQPDPISTSCPPPPPAPHRLTVRRPPPPPPPPVPPRPAPPHRAPPATAARHLPRHRSCPRWTGYVVRGRFWRRRPGFGRWGDLQESGGGGAGSGRWGLPAGSAWRPGSSSALSTPRAGPAAAALCQPPAQPRRAPPQPTNRPLLDIDSGEAATRAAPWVLVQKKQDEAEVREEQQEE